MSRKTLRQLLQETDGCVFAPCVYDCSSARALEMSGFSAMMFSSGEYSLAINGVVDYGFSSLAEVEWMVGRITATCSLPLAVDIEDGFGGPLAVYRTCKRLARVGAAAVQLEDAGDMEDSTGLLPRDQYYAKVAAALDALKGTDCMLIARTNADPATQLDEGCERMRVCHEMGAELTTVVKLSNYKDAKYVAERVPGWKMYPDVKAPGGIPEVRVEQIIPLGYKFMTTHFVLKAAMEGMLEHAKQNLKDQSVIYTYTNAPATGVLDFSATPFWEPQKYMALENSFTGSDKEYTIVGGAVEDFPEGYVKIDIKDRFS
jgi:methylisocitrate lyase